MVSVSNQPEKVPLGSPDDNPGSVARQNAAEGMRLTLVTPSLSGGGAERVVQRLAEGFIEAGHAVTVITTTSRPDFYELVPECDRISVDITGQIPGRASARSSLLRVPRGLWEFRKAIRSTEPDVVITFMEHVNVLTALLVGGNLRVVATEHINAAAMAPSMAWRLLRRIAYRRLDRLVSVSEGVDRCFEWLSESKRLVVLNPIDDQDSNEIHAVDEVEPYLVAMGRLTEQKGFDLLIDAFATISERHPEWTVRILGDGELRSELQQQIDEHGLTGRVILEGRASDPFPVISSAACFVLSSRAEGFPMVLIEALSCGTPAIAFDCPSGPAEILIDGENGLLLPPLRTDLLAAAMDELMGDPAERARLAASAASSVAHLHLDRIVAQWEREVFTRPGTDLSNAA